MITPSPLRKGQKVAIVATAKSIDKHAIDKAVDVFGDWGLEVTLGRHLFCIHHQFAGKDRQRTNDFQIAIDDPKVKAIFCVRGGYGTTRIIDDINFTPMRKNPKWVIGYSDVTALLCHLHNLGYESVHGIMPVLFGKGNADLSIESLRRLLFGEMTPYVVNPHPLNNFGSARGKLVGGNLSLLCHLIGSPSDIVLDGNILFIEDIDEHLYNIDRMMVQLKRAGKLENLAGLIVGHFTDIKDEGNVSFGANYTEVIKEHVIRFNFPVCFGFPAGHEPQNLALPVSRNCTLKVDKFGGVLDFG